MQPHFKSVAGLSLVEIMVTIFIASIAVTGMVVAYADGIGAWKRSNERILLYDEGSVALTKIDSLVTRATYLKTDSQWNFPGSELTVKGLRIVRGQEVTRSADFYFYEFDKSLRWDDRLGDQGRFNLRLIPMWNYPRNRGERPYITVESATFTPIDPIRPRNTLTEGYALIKIELVLSGERGDSLTLTKIVGKSNH